MHTFEYRIHIYIYTCVPDCLLPIDFYVLLVDFVAVRSSARGVALESQWATPAAARLAMGQWATAAAVVPGPPAESPSETNIL